MCQVSCFTHVLSKPPATLEEDASAFIPFVWGGSQGAGLLRCRFRASIHIVLDVMMLPGVACQPRGVGRGNSVMCWGKTVRKCHSCPICVSRVAAKWAPGMVCLKEGVGSCPQCMYLSTTRLGFDSRLHFLMTVLPVNQLSLSFLACKIGNTT